MAASLAGRIAWPRTLGEHITVALIPPVADHLRCLQKNTNMSADRSHEPRDHLVRVHRRTDASRERPDGPGQLDRRDPACPIRVRPRAGQARRRARPRSGRTGPGAPPGREPPATATA